MTVVLVGWRTDLGFAKKDSLLEREPQPLPGPFSSLPALVFVALSLGGRSIVIQGVSHEAYRLYVVELRSTSH